MHEEVFDELRDLVFESQFHELFERDMSALPTHAHSMQLRPVVFLLLQGLTHQIEMWKRTYVRTDALVKLLHILLTLRHRFHSVHAQLGMLLYGLKYLLEWWWTRFPTASPQRNLQRLHLAFALTWIIVTQDVIWVYTLYHLRFSQIIFIALYLLVLERPYFLLLGKWNRHCARYLQKGAWCTVSSNWELIMSDMDLLYLSDQQIEIILETVRVDWFVHSGNLISVIDTEHDLRIVIK